MNKSDTLLTRINEAVAAANEAENNVAVAQTELVSRSKTVGLLLLEGKKQHRKVADFDAFLKKVQGLKLSRAYDLLRLAGGRTTDEELREEARNRKRKSRDRQKEQKRKLPKPEPKPEPISVTHPHVTESAEVSIEQRRTANAALDVAAPDLSIPPFLDRTNDETGATPEQRRAELAALDPDYIVPDNEKESARAVDQFELVLQECVNRLLKIVPEITFDHHRTDALTIWDDARATVSGAIRNSKKKAA